MEPELETVPFETSELFEQRLHEELEQLANIRTCNKCGESLDIKAFPCFKKTPTGKTYHRQTCRSCLGFDETYGNSTIGGIIRGGFDIEAFHKELLNDSLKMRAVADKYGLSYQNMLYYRRQLKAKLAIKTS